MKTKTLRATEWEYPVNHNFTASYKGVIFLLPANKRQDLIEFAQKEGFTHILWDFEKVYSNRKNKKEKIV